MQARVQPAPIFADGMVLQQQSNVDIWGTSEPNSKIVVTADWSKKKTVTTSGADGRWKVKLSTPSAGGPYEIRFNDGDKVSIKNVMIGEVWICSGQSNMEMPLNGFSGQPVADAAHYIFSAKPSQPVRVCMLEPKVSYEVMDECSTKWLEHSPSQIGAASATAYFFARRLQETLDVPVGVVVVAVGGSPIEAWISESVLRADFADEFDFTHLQTKKRSRTKAHHDPCVLYNGMMHSVAGYTAKGFVWYQGCANVSQPEQYRRLQPAFVEMLRSEWGNTDMPFYYTQIAPHKTNTPDMMWAQALNVYDIPNSAMATMHDIGNYTSHHPSQKKITGDRLAFLALTRDYGLNIIDAQTPMPETYEYRDGEVIITFNVGTMGLTPRSVEIDGFELAGEDGVFYPAKAIVIRHKGHKSKSVKVYKCAEVTKPVAVRYAWSTWCPSTLYNCNGIPVTPFNSTIN